MLLCCMNKVMYYAVQKCVYQQLVVGGDPRVGYGIVHEAAHFHEQAMLPVCWRRQLVAHEVEFSEACAFVSFGLG